MADHSTTGAFLAQLLAGLATRPNLVDIDVRLVEPSAEQVPSGGFLYLVRGPIQTSDRIAIATMRRKRDETVTIPGVLQGWAATPEGGDDAVQAAFAAAEDILDELIAQIVAVWPAVGESTRSVLVEKLTWTPIPHDKGGWAVRGDYSLTYSSRVS